MNATLPIELKDEGVDLGSITKLDIIGDKTIASIPSEQKGQINITSFYDPAVNGQLAYGTISGEQTLQGSSLTFDTSMSDDNLLTYDEGNTTITFQQAGKYVLTLTTKALWDMSRLCDALFEFVPQFFNFSPVLKDAGMGSQDVFYNQVGGNAASCISTSWPPGNDKTSSYHWAYCSVGVNWTLDLFGGKFQSTAGLWPQTNDLELSIFQLRKITWVP